MKKNYFIMMCLLLTLLGCNNSQISNNDEIAYRSEVKSNYAESIYLTDYVNELNEEETKVFANESKQNHQGYGTKGIAKSSYYTTYVNDKLVNTYMIQTAERDPHSVCFLDVSEDKIKNGLTIKLDYFEEVSKVTLLPLKYNIIPTFTNKTISFFINDYGYYTIIPGNEFNPDKAYTIYVRKPEYIEVPYGYTLIEYKPGLHFIDPITIKSNTILYLHQGAFLLGKNPENGSESLAFIGASSAENIKIMGHGVLDMSPTYWHGARGIYLRNCKNIEINGVTLINSPTWTLTATNCDNLKIEDVIIFGYRTNSDGYAICSCEDVVVKNCFARSGDDLFEVKSYTGKESKNILFEDCIAWPDNCRGFGIVQETYSNISNVTYNNCSLLYQLNDWSEKMASFVITAGEMGSVDKVSFTNCDLFYSSVIAIRMSTGENDETMGTRNFNNKISNVTFKDCDFKYPASGNGIVKFRDNTKEKNSIQNIIFENVTFKDKKLNNISEINPVLENINESEFNFVTVK